MVYNTRIRPYTDRIVDQPQTLQLVFVLLLGIAGRALFFDHIGIWGDYGFYQYDARLILQGQRPFIDFIGRSPVLVYLYAGSVSLFGHPTEMVRMFMNFWWVMAALPVYGIARHVGGHTSGLASAGFFLLIPFSIVYSSWAGTQTVAGFFGVTAIFLLVKSKRVGTYALAGALLGLAYLSRRSMIVLLFAVGLYTIYQYVNYDRGSVTGFVRYTIPRGVAITGTFLLTLFAIYGAVASFDPDTTWALFEVHTGNLFLSYGRGGFPLLGSDAPIVTNSLGNGYIPIFNDICQLCGAWTARTIAKTITVTVPVIGILLYYLRDIEEFHFNESGVLYLYSVLGVLGLYAAVMTVLAGFYIRTAVIASLVLFAYLAHRTPALNRRLLYHRDLQLVLVILLGLAAGYLYRRRVLHTYYFMDFWPYLSVVGGLISVRAWQVSDKYSKYLMVAAIILGTVAAGMGAQPLTVIVLDGNNDGWFTIDNVHDTSQDINQRTEPGDVVFASNPTYVALTHTRLPMDRPRMHMVAARYKNSGPSERQYQVLIDQMRNGTIEYVIFSRTTKQMMRWNGTAKQAFEENYCRVPSADDLYQRTNGYLYKWVGGDDCHRSLQPRMNTTGLASPAGVEPVANSTGGGR